VELILSHYKNDLKNGCCEVAILLLVELILSHLKGFSLMMAACSRNPSFSGTYSLTLEQHLRKKTYKYNSRNPSFVGTDSLTGRDG